MRRQTVGAAVLVGGRSRRMGEDKAAVEIGDTSMLGVVCASLGSVVSRVLLVGGEDRYSSLGYEWVPDFYPAEGPLGGLITALATIHRPWCLMASCDSPLLRPAVSEYLTARALLSCGVDAVMPRHSGGLEPLHAVYSTSCIAQLLTLFDGGERALHEVTSVLRVLYVEEEQLRRLDPALHSFFNVNTPDDLTMARRLVDGTHGT